MLAGFSQRSGFACSRLEAACSACALWRRVLRAVLQRCAPTSVTCQVFSTLAPFMGFAPAESVLAVSRTPFGSPCPSFCCSVRLSVDRRYRHRCRSHWMPTCARFGEQVPLARWRIQARRHWRLSSFAGLPQVSRCCPRHCCRLSRRCHRLLIRIAADLHQRLGTRDVALVSPAQV